MAKFIASSLMALRSFTTESTEFSLEHKTSQNGLRYYKAAYLRWGFEGDTITVKSQTEIKKKRWIVLIRGDHWELEIQTLILLISESTKSTVIYNNNKIQFFIIYVPIQQPKANYRHSTV
jgi:hypothetical protein